MRLLHGRQKAYEVGLYEHYLEEELERDDGGVDARRADPLFRHMQPIAAKVVARGCVRRPAEKSREVPNVSDVEAPGVFPEPADLNR